MEMDRYVRHGYAGRKGLKPGSLGLAIGVNALILVGLSFTAPHFAPKPVDILVGRNIPLPPPPPLKPEPLPKEQHVTPRTETARPDIPEISHPPVPSNPTDTFTPTVDPTPGAGALDGTGTGTEITLRTEPVHPPVLVGPQVDPRYAGSFQPVYPPDERRAEHEGRVVVRVLIGVDGRVKDIQKVSAASDSFFAVTRTQALGKWRFKPATRDGVPVEGWRTMNVSFVLDAE